MPPTIQNKRGTASDIATVNPVLLAGEIAFETDTNRFKVGNGTTAWNSLPYAAQISSGATISGVNIISSSGNFNTLTVSSVPVSVSGHSHTSSNITNFNTAVSGLVSGIYQPLLTNPVTGVGTSGYLTKWISSSGISSGVIFDNGTNIGIGTTSPSKKLDVIGDARISGVLNIVNVGDSTDRSISVTNNEMTFASVHGIFGYSIGLRGSRGSACGMESNDTNGYLALAAGGSEKVRIATDGKVGVGITSPLDLIHVSGTSTGAQGIRLENADGYGGAIQADNGALYLSSSTATVCRLQASKIRMGDGITSTAIELTSNGSISQNGNGGGLTFSGTTAQFSNGINVTGSGIFTSIGVGTTTPSGQLHVIGTGIVSSRLGVGINNPQYPLDVVGNANISGILNISGVPLGEIIDDEVAGLLVAGSGINLSYNDSSNQLILSSENYYGANRGIIEVSSAASSFNIPGGYTVGGFDLFLNGVKLVNDVDFTATNGNNISTAYPIPSGSVLEYISLTLANPLRIASDQYSAEISREIISVTGTLSTINIIGGYDSGGLDVYKDGLKLIKDIQYSANNGSSISLITPATSGSVIEYVSFLAGKARRSINTATSSISAGTVPQTDYIYVATVPNITVNMPSAVGNNNRYTIKNLSNGTINVAPTPGQTIDNQSIISILNQYISIDLVSNNQNWIII